MGLPEKLEKRKILVVEGNDEEYFFEKLCGTVGLTEIQIVNMGGKDQFARDLPDIRNLSGFRGISHMGIVRDAEGDKRNALDSVRNILSNKFGYQNVPNEHGVFIDSAPKLGIFIMPGKIEGTMIEDLCLKIARNKPEYDCVNNFIECVEGKNITFQNKSKSTIQAFLAAQPVSFPRLGIAALHDVWNFNDPCVDELKAFLESFR